MNMKNRFIAITLAIASLALTHCGKTTPEKNCDQECAEKIKSDSIAEFKKHAPVEMIADEPAKAAAKGLVTIQKMADIQNFRLLGFESLEEVSKAQLGKSLPYHWMGCGLVLDAKASPDDLKSLLIRSQSMYLVKAGDKNRCGIMVDTTVDPDDKKMGAYGVTSFGDAVYAKDYDSALVRFKNIKAVDETGLMLVNIVAAGIPVWATSLDATGYVLPFVSHPIPCLANFKQPVTWREMFKTLQACKDAQVICRDTSFQVPPAEPPKAAQSTERQTSTETQESTETPKAATGQKK
jgi:hypothetical protein